MLRTNLASRPFYNERLVRAGLVLVGVAAIAFAIYSVAQGVAMQDRGRQLEAQIAEAASRAGALRAEAQQIRQSLNQQDVSAVQAAARQANRLIDQRAFSWTELFNHFEATLPADVRITAVQPQVDESGRMVIAITAVSRRVEDLQDFIEELEKSGAFSSTLATSEQVQEDGTLASQIQGYYRDTDAPATPAPESGAAQPSTTSTADARRFQ